MVPSNASRRCKQPHEIINHTITPSARFYGGINGSICELSLNQQALIEIYKQRNFPFVELRKLNY